MPTTRIPPNLIMPAHDAPQIGAPAHAGSAPGTSSPREAGLARSTASTPDADRISRAGDDAETHWQATIGGRQVIPSSAERSEAARRLAAQSPRLRDAADTSSQRAAIDIGQNRYDRAFEQAARIGPLGAKLLKSQDYQESNLTGDAPGGGIGQMDAAVAAKYGVSNIGDPRQTIPAQAAYERDTAKALASTYAQYGGDPKSPEFTKFVLGAYNAGMTTVADAMRLAHDGALERAKRNGANASDARASAAAAATTWNALFDASAGKMQSPFYRAVRDDLPVDPAQKYRITKSYVDEILTRARQ